jgi:signal peptidase II
MREMPGEERKRVSERRRYAVGGVIVAVLLGADQLSKHLIASRLYPGEMVEAIPPFVNFVRAHNAGGAFSLLAGKPWMFAAVSVLAIVVLAYLFTRFRGRLAASAAAAAILAGAAGNLADRFHYGHVVDFIDAHVGAWHWYVFNVADAAITVGALALFVLTFVDERRRNRKEKAEKEAAGPPAAAADGES